MLTCPIEHKDFDFMCVRKMMCECFVEIQDEHPAVAETAVIGTPHDVKGEG